MNTNTSPPALLKHNVSGWPLSDAKRIADSLVKSLNIHCERIYIAGSVRREKEFVKDIEIVCQPRMTVLKDMFGWNEGLIVDLGFTAALERLGEVVKGNTDGKYQIKLPLGGVLLIRMVNVLPHGSRRRSFLNG